MTMFSAENRQFCGGDYGGGYGGEGFGVMSQLQGYAFSSALGSDLEMAENELRTDNTNLNVEAEESSSKEERDEGWLQLSIGGQVKLQDHNGSGPVELELMPSSSNNSSSHSQMRPLIEPEFRPPRPLTNFSPSFFLQHPAGTSSFHQDHINWPFRPMPITLSNSSSSSLPSPSSYFPRPFQLYPGLDMAALPGRGVDFRVIQPPRRPHSGLWFMLQASQNQEKEPFLPQISKSYLRIKDGKMTVRLVIKYLVNKLSLENESEIEIRCKGQRLVPFLTLQHVRDNIWSSPRDFITLLPNTSTTHHIMVLHYARTTSSN